VRDAGQQPVALIDLIAGLAHDDEVSNPFRNTGALTCADRFLKRGYKS
jgi:hypothetical protein